MPKSGLMDLPGLLGRVRPLGRPGVSFHPVVDRSPQLQKLGLGRGGRVTDPGDDRLHGPRVVRAQRDPPAYCCEAAEVCEREAGCRQLRRLHLRLVRHQRRVPQRPQLLGVHVAGATHRGHNDAAEREAQQLLSSPERG